MSFQDMLKQYNIPYKPKESSGLGVSGWILLIVLGTLLIAGILSLAGVLVMCLWNFVFPIYPLTFLQGVALVLLSSMLFGKVPNNK